MFFEYAFRVVFVFLCCLFICKRKSETTELKYFFKSIIVTHKNANEILAFLFKLSLSIYRLTVFLCLSDRGEALLYDIVTFP